MDGDNLDLVLEMEYNKDMVTEATEKHVVSAACHRELTAEEVEGKDGYGVEAVEAVEDTEEVCVCVFHLWGVCGTCCGLFL